MTLVEPGALREEIGALAVIRGVDGDPALDFGSTSTPASGR